MRIAVFCFGRFNPPTIGHRLLAQSVMIRARQELTKNHGAQVDAFFVMSGKDDGKKEENPLSVDDKILMAKQVFASIHPLTIRRSISGTAPLEAKEFCKTYDKVVYVAGDDQKKNGLMDGVKTAVVKESKRLYDEVVLVREKSIRTGEKKDYDFYERFIPTEKNMSGTYARGLIQYAFKEKFAEAIGLPQNKADVWFKKLHKALYK